MIKKEEIEVKEFIKPALVNTVSAVKETQESIIRICDNISLVSSGEEHQQ